MHCHTSEPSTFFESTETLKTLALPWLEEDFAAGQTSNPQETLESGNRDSGMWASLIRILTLWFAFSIKAQMTVRLIVQVGCLLLSTSRVQTQL